MTLTSDLSIKFGRLALSVEICYYFIRLLAVLLTVNHLLGMDGDHQHFDLEIPYIHCVSKNKQAVYSYKRAVEKLRTKYEFSTVFCSYVTSPNGTHGRSRRRTRICGPRDLNH